MRDLKRFFADENGATMVEFTLIFVLMMLLTFGLVEFGLAFYQYNAAEKATAIGARYISTRGPVLTGLGDCGPTSGTGQVNTGSVNAGVYCSTVAGSSGWSRTCNATSPAAGCQAAVLTALVTRMRQFDPNIEAQNVQVVLRGSGLGFVGRGAPVPLVTVRLTGMTFDFIALDDLLGFGPINMPAFDATIVGEDMNGAGA
jgi:Flp pilus assembly protein TadG